MTAIMVDILQWILIGLSVVAFLRLVLGPSAADRLVALNVLGALVLAFLTVRALDEGRSLYLDVALIYDIFGFLGFLAIARFLRDRIGSEENSSSNSSSDGGTQ